jgi:hypothetical protein
VWTGYARDTRPIAELRGYSITSCRYMGGVPAGPEGALGSRTAHGAGDVVL